MSPSALSVFAVDEENEWGPESPSGSKNEWVAMSAPRLPPALFPSVLIALLVPASLQPRGSLSCPKNQADLSPIPRLPC